MKKTRWYKVFSDDRKRNLQGFMLVRTDPRGGPYPYRWVNTGGVVQTSAPVNTHRSAVLTNDRVSYEYLHRRCRPTKEISADEVETQFRIDLGVDTDTPEFIEDSPIKMGETYNPDTVPAN